MHRLFVDVGYELSENQLRQHFTRYGAVSDVYLPKHSMGRNKGYAFVTFTSEQALSQALLDTQPVVNGIKLKVKRATPRPPGKVEPNAPSQSITASVPNLSSARIFVEGVAADVSEVHVQRHFAKWGLVTHVAFSAAPQGKDCIVTFDSQIDAKRACDQSERILDGRAIKSISLVVHSNREQPHSHSLSSGSSEASSEKARFGASSQAGRMEAAAADAAASNLAANDAVLMASRLRTTNPSAYATWLHLEQMQQQLLAEYAHGVLASHLQQGSRPESATNSPQKMLPQQYMPENPGALPYGLPYLPSGYAPNTDSQQQNLDAMLSKLYSQPSSQPIPEVYSRFSQSSPYSAGSDIVYSQPAQSTGNSEALNAYLKGLQGLNASLDHGQIDSTNHLRNLAQQAVVNAGTPGLAGRLDDMKSAESQFRDVPMQDHVHSNYSSPPWTPF